MPKRSVWIIAVVCALAVLARLFFHATERSRQKSAVPALAQDPQIAYSQYVNVRFAFSVCYPKQVLLPQGESPNGDGQKFVSGDGQASASAFGANNALKQTLPQVLAQDAKGLTLTGKAVESDRFMFTGQTSDNVLEIEETLARNQQFKTLNLRFPAAQAPTYRPIADRMIACFANTTPTQYSR